MMPVERFCRVPETVLLSVARAPQWKVGLLVAMTARKSQYTVSGFRAGMTDILLVSVMLPTGTEHHLLYCGDPN